MDPYRKREETETNNFEAKLDQAEYNLEQARKEGASFQQESINLRQRLVLLESELQEARQRIQQPVKEPSGQASGEIHSLRQEIEALKQQQFKSASATNVADESVLREVHELQEAMKRKDSQVENLQRELHTLTDDLSSSRNYLAAKKEQVEKLSSELAHLRSQGSQRATSRVLELTRDEAENSEQMRAQIISLAKALEQSEGRRAEAIDRVEREREANADSLRRLTESVKRFYSTLNFGDT